MQALGTSSGLNLVLIEQDQWICTLAQKLSLYCPTCFIAWPAIALASVMPLSVPISRSRNGILVGRNSYVTSFMNDADTNMMRQYLYCSGRNEMMHFCNTVV